MLTDKVLDPRRLQLIELMTQGYTKADIAKKIGVSRQSVYTWLAEPELKKLLEDMKKDVTRAATNKINNKLDSYIDQMDHIALHAKDERTRNNACQYLINRSLGMPSVKADVAEDGKANMTDDMLDKAVAKAKAKLHVVSDDDKDNSNDDECEG